MGFASTFREARATDYAALADVMHDAIRNGPSPYSDQQRAAWSPVPPGGAAWDARLARQTVVLAEQGGTVVGFMSLAEGGYIDLAHIRPGARGRGLFRALFESIEAVAQARGEHRLWLHASLLARPAFAAFGFHERERETVEVAGQRLLRFVMERGSLATATELAENHAKGG